MTLVALQSADVAVAAAAAKPDTQLADRFAVAPKTAPDHQLIVQTTVNGIDFGNQMVRIVKGSIILPATTLRALGIDAAIETLDLAQATDIGSRLDESRGTLALTIPHRRFSARRFAPETSAVPDLSPETWGAYVNYDMNFRHEFSSSRMYGSNFGGPGHRSTAIGTFGGLADVRVLASDILGDFGFAYDGMNSRRNALIRLDSTLTWRPKHLGFALSAGDVTSATSLIAEARPYRFGGVQIGTEFSGRPGWTSSPIRSVSGTAQAQSAIDVYLNGQRTFHGDTPGGDFSLVLPPGATGTGTNVVVTDVTGRAVVLPVEVSRIDAQLLRRNLLLWSVGIGAPRFAYGSSVSNYDRDIYGDANLRYGVSNALSATAHVEAGHGLFEAEGGADYAVTSAVGVHGLIAASRSRTGAGGAASASVTMLGPWNLAFDAIAGHTFGRFEDVVSVSGRTYARHSGIDPVFSLPPESQVSGRLSWQPATQLALTASYQANSYPGSSQVGFVTVGGNYLIRNRIPSFLNISHATGRQRTTAILLGFSFSFGKIQASASGGYGMGGAHDQNGFNGGVDVSKSLGQAMGDVGWNAYATRSPSGNFVNSDIQVRTGYAIPGIAVQSFANQVTTYATLKGSMGVIGGHPFLADPIDGGIIIADVGRPGVPVELNGYSKGHTSFDGKMALTGAVAGTQQRIAIDAEHISIDVVPSATDELATVREGGATVVKFGVQSSSSSALLNVTVDGAPPPLGSILIARSSTVPISREGRAYVPSLARDEVLTVEIADGKRCRVETHFDGAGGVGRRIGTFACRAINP